MKYNYIFPTCVFSDEQPDLANSILPICEQYLNEYGQVFTNNNNHVSTYRNFQASQLLAKEEVIKPFLNYIVENSLDFLRYQNVDTTRYENDIRSIQHLLVNKVSKGGFHPKHSHPMSLISGCFYLKCLDNSTPIIFSDPRNYYRYIVYDQKPSIEKPSCLYPDFTVPVKQGLLLMWPSWMEHEVPFSEIEEDRITIAFNIGKIA